MARGTNSSKYIQSLGSQDVREARRGCLLARRGCTVDEGKEEVRIGSRIDMHASMPGREKALVFSQCVKWDKRVYRFSHRTCLH